MEIGEALGLAVFLAVFVKAALDRLASLAQAAWPGVNLSVPFGALAILAGVALGWLAGVNVFAGLPIDPMLGRALSAIAVGFGVEFLNDVTAVAQGRRSLFGDLVEAPRSLADDEQPEYEVSLGREPKARGW